MLALRKSSNSLHSKACAISNPAPRSHKAMMAPDEERAAATAYADAANEIDLLQERIDREQNRQQQQQLLRSLQAALVQKHRAQARLVAHIRAQAEEARQQRLAAQQQLQQQRQPLHEQNPLNRRLEQ